MMEKNEMQVQEDAPTCTMNTPARPEAAGGSSAGGESGKEAHDAAGELNDDDTTLKAIAMHYESQGILIVARHSASETATTSSTSSTATTAASASAPNPMKATSGSACGVEAGSTYDTGTRKEHDAMEPPQELEKPCLKRAEGVERTPTNTPTSPGAYSNAPGQGMHRNNTLQYDRVYNQQVHHHHQNQQGIRRCKRNSGSRKCRRARRTTSDGSSGCRRGKPTARHGQWRRSCSQVEPERQQQQEQEITMLPPEDNHGYSPTDRSSVSRPRLLPDEEQEGPPQESEEFPIVGEDGVAGSRTMPHSETSATNQSSCSCATCPIHQQLQRNLSIVSDVTMEAICEDPSGCDHDDHDHCGEDYDCDSSWQEQDLECGIRRSIVAYPSSSVSSCGHRHHHHHHKMDATSNASQSDRDEDTASYGNGSDSSSSNSLTSDNMNDNEDHDSTEDDDDSGYFPMLGDRSNQVNHSNSSRHRQRDQAALPIAAEVVDEHDETNSHSLRRFEFTSMRLLDEETRERVMQELVDDCSVSVATTVSAASETSKNKRRRSKEGNGGTQWLLPGVAGSGNYYNDTRLVALISIAINILLIILLTRSNSNTSTNSTSTNPINMTHVNDGTSIIATESSSHSSNNNDALHLTTLGDYDDSTVIATVPETICSEAAPLMGASESCPPQPLGSAVSNLVAQSRLWSVPNADISLLINAGEINAGVNIAQGDMTIAMAKSIFLDSESFLFSIPMTGEQIVLFLEQGIEKVWDNVMIHQSFHHNNDPPQGGGAGSWYPYGAGIRFDVDMTQSFPHRVSHIQVKKKSLLDYDSTADKNGIWESLDLERAYTVVTSSYNLVGDGGVHDHLFEFLEGEKQQAVQYHDLNSLAEFVSYCQHAGVLREPSKEDFSTQSYVHSSELVY